VVEQFLPVFLLLSQDHQDSVRLLCIENCIAISGLLTDELKEQHIKPVLITCSNDPAWRVRYMVANFYHNLVSVLGGVVTPEILKGYISLLKDIEPEVRSAATNSISGISSLLTTESVLENILPCVQALVTDESQFVRASLAKNIGGLSPILGPENTSNHLLELYLTLLRDDFSEVRLNLLSHLSNMTDIMRNNRISNTLLHALDQLISDNNWRTRLAAVEHLSVIASEMGIELFQQTNLANICFSLLGDKVFAIRNAGIENLISISGVFGISWAKENIIPKIKELAKHNNYIYRLTTLISISKLAHLFKGEDVVSLLIPILADLSGDKVPNIRFNVCKTLDTICSILNGDIKNTNILPILIILQKDSDKDVRRFAESAIKSNFANGN
jgi:serine/threonine-protein phosphatase 2A regulatory subunit A